MIQQTFVFRIHRFTSLEKSTFHTFNFILGLEAIVVSNKSVLFFKTWPQLKKNARGTLVCYHTQVEKR